MCILYIGCKNNIFTHFHQIPKCFMEGSQHIHISLQPKYTLTIAMQIYEISNSTKFFIASTQNWWGKFYGLWIYICLYPSVYV